MRKYFLNTSYLMVEKAFRLISGVIVGIWVARYLGPEDFGLLSYSQAVIFFLASVAGLGLDSIVVRDLLGKRASPEKIMGTSFFLKLATSFLFTLIFAGIVLNYYDESPSTLILFILSLCLIFQSLNVIDLSFQARVLSKYVVFSNCIALGISSLTKIYLILIKAQLVWFSLAILIDAIVLSLGLLYWYKQKGIESTANWKFDFVVAKTLLRDSWPLIFSSVLVAIYMKIDQVMIKHMIGNASAGVYAASIKLSEIWYIVPVAICASLFPALVNAKSISTELYQKRLVMLYSLLIWMAICVSIVTVVIGEELVLFLYGDDYKESGKIFILHMWSGVFAFLGIAFGKFLAIEGLTKKSMVRTFYGALLNIVLNFFLIPAYGLIGAACATLFSQFISNYLYDYFDGTLRRYIHLKNNAFMFPFIYLYSKFTHGKS